MFRNLLRNTMISAAAYFVASLTGLLLVPVLIDAYGWTQFGLIVLVRTMLPSGLLGLFDLGFSELTTQAVARARADADWERAGQTLSFLLLTALGIGALLGMTLHTLAPQLARWLQTPPEHHASLVTVLRLTGWSLLWIFPSLVLDGIAKGFEAFGLLRSIEVSSNLGYAGAVFFCVAWDLPYEWVICAFLLSLLMRYASLAWSARRLSQASGLKPMRWTPDLRIELYGRLRAMAFNRCIGTLERQGVLPLIGLWFGPAATAAYDVLVRVPWFLKAIVGLLNSALIPIAARLEASQDAAGMQRLGSYTLIASACVTLPPLGAAAVYSEPILRLWVGPDIAANWVWQAMLFLDPMATAIVGAGATALVVRTTAFAHLTTISGWRLLVQYAVSFCALPWLQEHAFILGQSLAIALGLPWQLRAIRNEQTLPGHVMRKLGTILLLGAVWIACGLGMQYGIFRPNSWLTLIACAVLWTALFQCALFFCVFSRAERQRMVQAVRGRNERSQEHP